MFAIFGHCSRIFGDYNKIISEHMMIKAKNQTIVKNRNHPYVQGLVKNGNEILGD